MRGETTPLPCLPLRLPPPPPDPLPASIRVIYVLPLSRYRPASLLHLACFPFSLPLCLPLPPYPILLSPSLSSVPLSLAPSALVLPPLSKPSLSFTPSLSLLPSLCLSLASPFLLHLTTTKPHPNRLPLLKTTHVSLLLPPSSSSPSLRRNLSCLLLLL